MISVKEWMELVDFKITEGSDYLWNCFGSNAYCLSSWNQDHDGYSFCIVFDTHTQEVYTVEACDYKNERAYRMVNPTYKQQHDIEASDRCVSVNQAWDDIYYVDLEVDDDFIQKSLAIKTGENYDTRVSVPVEFSDEELLKYMKLAHERDMTFNQFIEEALRHAIEEFKRDPDGLTRKAKEFF